MARLKLELIPVCSYKRASRLNLGSQAGLKTNWSGQAHPCEQMGQVGSATHENNLGSKMVSARRALKIERQAEKVLK